MMEKKILDFGLIARPIDTLLTAFDNTIQREWPEKWDGLLDARLLVHGSVKLSSTTYQLIRFLCKDRFIDPWQTRRFVTAAAPLTRSILDSLFALVYLFDDIRAKSDIFVKGGWREMCEETERMKREYGSTPKWVEYLDERAKRMDIMQKARGMPPCGPETSKLPYWPTPGQMMRSNQLADERRKFLTYLNDWYYRELSSAAHLSFPGLIIRGSPLLIEDDSSETKLNVLRSYYLTQTICVVLALLSEVQIEAGFGFADRLKYVWRIVTEFFDDAKEIYEMRYAARL